MEPKTIVAIMLVAFIIGGFIFLQIINDFQLQHHVTDVHLS